MQVPVRFYFNFRWKLTAGLFFLLTAIVFGTTIVTMFSNPFNLIYFFMTSIFMAICSYALFQFIKALFSPTLQIFETEIVLNRLRRECISKVDLEELFVRKRFVKVCYKKNGKMISKQFQIQRHRQADINL